MDQGPLCCTRRDEDKPEKHVYETMGQVYSTAAVPPPPARRFVHRHPGLVQNPSGIPGAFRRNRGNKETKLKLMKATEEEKEKQEDKRAVEVAQVVQGKLDEVSLSSEDAKEGWEMVSDQTEPWELVEAVV